MESFAPGDLVHARGREWIALPSPEPDWLCLRPLSGAESDALLLDPVLEREPVRPARFDPPELSDTATQDGARLLSDALHLSMRRGAGPFRAADAWLRASGVPARSAAYGVALADGQAPHRRRRRHRQDDRRRPHSSRTDGSRRRSIPFAVLCPPHLVDQWVTRIEDPLRPRRRRGHRRRPPPGWSAACRSPRPFSTPIPSPSSASTTSRPTSVATASPEAVRRCVVVDEAHACVGTQRGKQQRFELLSDSLAEDASRHMVLLTATPHSGNEQAFDRSAVPPRPLLCCRGVRRGELSRSVWRATIVQRRRADYRRARLGPAPRLPAPRND